MLRQIFGRISTASKAILRSKYDALDLLRSDHMKAEAMLIQLRLMRDREKRRKLLKQIRNALEKHMHLEEDVFYPACERVPRIKKIMDQSHRDHELVKSALKELTEINPKTPRFDSVLAKMILAIEKHVITEENTVFGGIRQHMKPNDFQRLSAEMISAHAGKRAARPTRRAA